MTQPPNSLQALRILRDALQNILDSIPAYADGGFFTEHFTQDGEPCGIQQHDPVEIIGYIDCLARAALDNSRATEGSTDAPSGAIWCDACGADRSKEFCLRMNGEGCSFVGTAYTHPAPTAEVAGGEDVKRTSANFALVAQPAGAPAERCTYPNCDCDQDHSCDPPPAAEVESREDDPLDWPIPCDLVDGAVTLRKGVKLRPVLARMKMLSNAARAAFTQPAADHTKRAEGWNRNTLVERLYNEPPDYGLCVEAGAEIQRLRAELAQRAQQAGGDAVDAARYRFLRNRINVQKQAAMAGPSRLAFTIRFGRSFVNGEQKHEQPEKNALVDAVIDAARAASDTQGEG